MENPRTIKIYYSDENSLWEVIEEGKTEILANSIQKNDIISHGVTIASKRQPCLLKFCHIDKPAEIIWTFGNP